MERAKKIWEELGLPKLKPEAPWFGYSLGEWWPGIRRDGGARRPRRLSREREALESAGAEDVGMNTEVRRVDEGAPHRGAG